MKPSVKLRFFLGGLAALAVLAANAALAERLAIISDIANIRSGPGTDTEVLWQVEKYYPITVLQKQGDWVLFKDFEGDEGWIHKSLVAPLDTVVVKKDNCNVRSGPGTDHEISFVAERGIPFKVLKRQGDWVQIQHADGDTGWIHKNLIW
ncbi:MAG: SH3 domain-containing protein [Desulfosarcinaceae bacterium]|jgi:SH3-like domain-containing protein